MSRIKQWTVSGRVYQKTGAADGDITIEEQAQDDASIPVNAPLAVSLMQQLIGLIPQEVLYPGTVKSLSQQLYDLYRSGIAEASSEKKVNTAESVDKSFLEVVDKVKELEHVTTLLLRNSLGISADKSTLLKALSQPGCEGLRFYQCVSGSATLPPDKLSFVMLGVDGENNDLGFTFDETIKKEIERIPTESFCAEYNLTSGPVDFYHLDDGNAALKPYVLLKFALNASERPNPPQPAEKQKMTANEKR